MDALKNVQWVYLAVAIFVFLLAVVFFFAVIPEVTGRLRRDVYRTSVLTTDRCGHGSPARQRRRGWRHRGKAIQKTVQGLPRRICQFLLCWSSRFVWQFLVSSILTTLTVAIASYFINYITETRGATSSALGAQFLAIAQGCFTIGRFIGSGMRQVNACCCHC